MNPSTTPIKSMARIRAIVKTKIIKKGDVEIDVLVADVIKILEADREFMVEFISESLLPVVRYVVYSTIGLTRRNSLKATTRIGILGPGSWNERVNRGHYVKIMNMTREEALQAAELRRKRATDETKVAVWLEELARPLKPGEKIGDRYTDEHVQATWQRVEEQYGVPTLEMPAEV